jgi:hypothetical protein
MSLSSGLNPEFNGSSRGIYMGSEKEVSMRRALPVLILCLACVSPTLIAQGSQTLFVPVAAHLPAAGGATWESDVRIYNGNNEDTTVDLTFLRAGQDNSSASGVSMTVQAQQALLLEDVVSSTFGLQDYGAIRTQSTLPLVVSASTYNKAPFTFPGIVEPRRETFQTEAVDDTEWPSTAPRVLFVANRFLSIEAGPSLRDSTTNVGILNPNPYLISVTVSLTDETQSTPLGSQTLTLPPYGFSQIVDLFDAFGAAGLRIDQALLLLEASRGVSASLEPAAIVAYAVRQTSTSDTCGGVAKQADFLLAKRIP